MPQNVICQTLGVSNIKTLQRQAYGYRDMEYFRLKLFALHRSNHKLIG